MWTPVVTILRLEGGGGALNILIQSWGGGGGGGGLRFWLQALSDQSMFGFYDILLQTILLFMVMIWEGVEVCFDTLCVHKHLEKDGLLSASVEVYSMVLFDVLYMKRLHGNYTLAILLLYSLPKTFLQICWTPEMSFWLLHTEPPEVELWYFRLKYYLKDCLGAYVYGEKHTRLAAIGCILFLSVSEPPTCQQFFPLLWLTNTHCICLYAVKCLFNNESDCYIFCVYVYHKYTLVKQSFWAFYLFINLIVTPFSAYLYQIILLVSVYWCCAFSVCDKNKLTYMPLLYTYIYRHPFKLACAPMHTHTHSCARGLATWIRMNEEL